MTMILFLQNVYVKRSEVHHNQMRIVELTYYNLYIANLNFLVFFGIQ